MPKDANVEIPRLILNSPPTKAGTETVRGENSTGKPTALSRKQTVPGPQATRPTPLQKEQCCHMQQTLYARPLTT